MSYETIKPTKNKLSPSLSRKNLRCVFRPNHSPGFTIIELLVVIVIIGILASISIVSYGGISQRTVVVSLQSDLANAKKQLQTYRAENGAYPDEVDDCPTPAEGNLCLKSSTGNSFSNYSVNNATYPPTFTLDAINGNTAYRITDSTTPVAVVPEVPPASNTFVMGLGGTSSNNGTDVVQTSDGGYAVTGYTDSYTAGAEDMFLAKYGSDGSLSWFKTWGGAGNDDGYSLVQTSDGGYAVTGHTNSYTAGGYDMFLAKYASDGSLSWLKTWGGASDDYGFSLVQTSDGGYAVTGYTSSYTAGSYDMYLAKYTSDGSLSWSKTWGGAGLDSAYSLVQTSDGGYAVTGNTKSYTAGDYDAYLAKYASDGSLSWSKTWGGAAYDAVNSLVQTSDGGYAVTGETISYTAGSYDMYLAKYTSDGSLSWLKTWGGASFDSGDALVQTSDGGYAVAGETESYGNGVEDEIDDMYLAKYTSDGSLSWSKTWGGAAYDSIGSLVQTSDGGYAITGETESYTVGVSDMYLAKYNSSGTITNCSSPMCQDQSVTGVDRTVTSVDRTVTSVDRTVTSVDRTVTGVDRTVTTSTIVAP